MPLSNSVSDRSPQVTEVPHVLTSKEKVVLRTRLAALPSPEEMKQKLQQLLDNYREIVVICEILLDEKRR